MEPADHRPDDDGPGPPAVQQRRAAMEPADHRPDDMRKSLPRAHSTIKPQWSRPIIGRTTATPTAVGTLNYVPQWSLPIIGRTTCSAPCGSCSTRCCRNGAGRSSAGRPRLASTADRTHWSRNGAGRSSAGRRRRSPRQEVTIMAAAMEPADHRPDDGHHRAFRDAGEAAAMEPADHRPDDLALMALVKLEEGLPQWSRPIIGRTTSVTALQGHQLGTPQWSPPIIGRTTAGDAVAGPGGARAAMEPADHRPDDGTGPRPAPRRLRAAMEPADHRPDDRPDRAAHPGQPRAAMEPADHRPDDRQGGPMDPSPHRGRNGAGRSSAGRPAPAGSDLVQGGEAAMEPADHRPDDGSRNSSRLSCANGRSCERFALNGINSTLCGVVKMRKRPLTCVRALPGARVTTPALARRWHAPRTASHNDRAGYRQFLMRAEEQEPGQVTDRAEVDDHDAVFGHLH